MMRAGKLRFRLEIQQPVETRDAIGGVVQTWTKVRQVWADLEPLKGLELLEAAKVEPRLSHRVTLRYAPDLTPSSRLSQPATGRVFQPFSVRDVHERQRQTEVLAMEII